MSDASLDEAAVRLAGARHVLVFSGAGISAESGVSTFRDAGGLWEQHSIEEVATLEGFHRNPTLVWEFYESRRRSIASVEPNPGHRAIARMVEIVPEITVVTQNVDGLHQRAGSKNVIEIHGSLQRARCAEGCGRILDPFPVPSPAIPPLCTCGGLLRPDVVWFGEMLPLEVWDAAARAASRCDVVLVVGTSGAVWPAAGIPVQARREGALAIEVNPESTELTAHVDLVLRGPSGEVLPQVVDCMSVHRRSRGAVSQENS